MGQADLPAHGHEQTDYLYIDHMHKSYIYMWVTFMLFHLFDPVQTAITVHAMQVFLRVLGSCYHGDPAGNGSPLVLHIFTIMGPQLVLTWRQVIKIYTVTQLKCWKLLEPSTSIRSYKPVLIHAVSAIAWFYIREPLRQNHQVDYIMPL